MVVRTNSVTVCAEVASAASARKPSSDSELANSDSTSRRIASSSEQASARHDARSAGGLARAS